MKRAFVVLASAIFLWALSVGVALAQPDGKAIAGIACSKCHGIKKVASAKKNASEWEVTLDRMIKKGAKVEPEERDAVLKYLQTL